MKPIVLVVDDDEKVRTALERCLALRGWQVSEAYDARTTIAAYDRDHPHVVLLDLDLPGLSGMHILELLRQRDPDATVIILTGNGEVSSAVEAMRLGAENFLTKPVALDYLEVALARALEHATLRRCSRFYGERIRDDSELAALHRVPATREVARQVELLAGGTAPVLLTGETGTGKGWIARLIHALSARAQRPFVSVNCAGLSATFLDSELFGHERGAFTDAKTQKIGLFEVANGGTLFLDEIGDLAQELQPKLLTVIESKRFRRLGGTKELEVDVRLVAATHHDLKGAVGAGRFREDLYYRLAVFPVHLPPLRERGREAITELTHSILGDLRRRIGRGPEKVSSEALALIVKDPWPGNIRQLQNTLERAILLAGGSGELLPSHLPPELRAGPAPEDEPLGNDLSLETVERRHIERVLKHFGGNRSRAARALGITRSTLYQKLART